MEIQMVGGVFELGNPEGRGTQALLEIQVEGGGGVKKPCLPSWTLDFFWNNPITVNKKNQANKCIFFRTFLVLFCFKMNDAMS